MSLIDDLQRRWRASRLEAAIPPVAGASQLNRLRSSPALVRIALATLLALAVYYGPIGWAADDVDTDLSLRPDTASLPAGGSAAVGFAAQLLDREVEVHGWTPDDPFFYPTALLDDMPAFQRGIRSGVAAFVVGLRDRLTALGEPGAANLGMASEGLLRPADQWWLHRSWPFIGDSAESGLRDAVASLRSYNAEVAARHARFDRDAGTLADCLDQLAANLDTAGAATERQLAGKSDEGMDETYYAVRGRAYAAALLLRGLRSDFGMLLRARQLGVAWSEAMEAVDAVAVQDVWHVGDDDLTRQGYHLLLARDKLRTLAATLRRA